MGRPELIIFRQKFIFVIQINVIARFFAISFIIAFIIQFNACYFMPTYLIIRLFSFELF